MKNHIVQQVKINIIKKILVNNFHIKLKNNSKNKNNHKKIMSNNLRFKNNLQPKQQIKRKKNKPIKKWKTVNKPRLKNNIYKNNTKNKRDTKNKKNTKNKTQKHLLKIITNKLKNNLINKKMNFWKIVKQPLVITIKINLVSQIKLK